jgi:DNA-directed RNA polymerase subunit beta'
MSSTASRFSEATDEATGITKRQVIDWRSTPRGADLKPAIVIKGKDGEIAKLPWR